MKTAWISVAATLLLLWLADAPTRAEEAVPSVLARDARLEAPLAVAVKDRPLGEVLPELGKKLDVPLTAARETADDKITLFIKERPAREVLALISTHFDFQWRRDRDGYRLGQDLASRRREAAIREAKDAAEIALLRRKLERIAALGPVSREALQARQEEMRALFQSPDVPAAEKVRAAEEMEVWQHAASPFTPATLGVLQRLSPAQQAMLWSGEPLEFSTQERTLPNEVAAQIRRAMSQQATESLADYLDASITLTVNRPTGGHPNLAGNEPTYGLNVMVHVHRSNGSRGSGWGISAKSVSFPEPEAVIDDPDLLQPVELPPLQSRVTPRDRLLQGLQFRRPPTRTLGDALEILHEQTGLDYLSDSYTGMRFSPPYDRSMLQRQPLGKLLITLSRERQYDWAKDGSLVRLRSRRYAFDRIAEVPRTVLDDFREVATRDGRPDLDDFAVLTARLSDAQLASLASFWPWYLPEATVVPPSPTNIHQGRHMLRWWSTLSPAQRSALTAPGGLSVLDLAPEQQRLLFSALRNPEARRYGGTGTLPASPEAAARLVVRLQSQSELMEVFGNTGDEIRSTSRRSAGTNSPPPGDLVLLGPPVRTLSYGFSISMAGSDGMSGARAVANYPFTVHHLPALPEPAAGSDR
jgi:hypothetical protein